MVINIRNPNSGAVAKTRVRVTPRVRVRVSVRVEGEGGGECESKGGAEGGVDLKGMGEGVFKDSVKAYGT